MKHLKFFSRIILITVFLLASCKSAKNTTNSPVENLSTKKIISSYYSQSFNKRTVNAKINAKYNGSKSSASFSIKLRLEKDKTIWMSATKFGFPIAKVKITPTRVSYYEKIQRTYFDGDFSLLSKFLGTELDYEKVQNILLGQAVLNLKKGKYDSELFNNKYQLAPREQNELFGILFFLNPDNFKLNSQEIRNDEKQQVLSVSYPKYNEIKGEQFPKNIHIRAVDNKKLTTINMEYKTVEFNENLTFPFTIPNGYKEIRLK